jgi:hypothetical protein
MGPIQPPLQWVPGGLSPEVKRLGREAGYSPSSSAKVKNGGAITPFSHTKFYKGSRTLPDYLDKRPKLRKMNMIYGT